MGSVPIFPIITIFPIIKLLYTSAKDLMGVFVGEKKFFDKPVLVSLLPDSETKVIGFITREDLNSLGLSGSVAVYMPQAYNFAGKKSGDTIPIVH
jgi:uncharacterized membrane protein